MYHVSISQKKGGVATLVSEKVDYRAKTITRHNESNFIIKKIIKGQLKRIIKVQLIKRL